MDDTQQEIWALEMFIDSLLSWNVRAENMHGYIDLVKQTVDDLDDLREQLLRFAQSGEPKRGE